MFPVHLPLAADDTRWLLIGPRPDDSLYDRQERELLAELAHPLAHALRLAADRTARQVDTDARFNRLEQELQTLKEAIAGPAAAVTA